MKTEEIIFKEFQQWIYNDQNQSGDKLQVIDASDLPEIIKEVVKTLAMLPTFKITDMETVYEFYYNDCIHESMAACISLHRTRKGAEMAMEFHKEQKRKEFEELYKDEEDIDWTFDSMCAWGVNERTVVE